MRNDKVFQAFDSVLSVTAAGFHDGQKAFVDIGSAWNPVIAHHEGIHERIFASSTDGVVLSSLLRLTMTEWKNHPKVPSFLGIITQTLLENSRLAHEAAATYLGIKQFSPGPGDEVYERLPPEYLRYYEAMSEPVERHFRGFYLQYTMAVAIWSVTFSSTYAKKILASGLSKVPMPVKQDLPDERFLEIARMLTKADPGELRTLVFETARTVCREEGHEPWDFDDDARWQSNIRNDSEINSRIEAAISAVTKRWIQERVGFPSVLDRDETKQVLKAWMNLMRPWIPFVDSTQILDAEVFRDVDPELAGAEHKIVEAYLQSDSKMTNFKSHKLGKFESGRFEGDKLFEKLGSFLIVSMCPPDHLTEWIFVGWKDEAAGNEGSDPVLLGRVDAETGKDWLRRWTDRSFQDQKIPKAHSIVFAVNSISEFMDSLDGVLAFMSRKTDGLDIGPGLFVLGWYWTGNWFDCVKVFAKKFQVQYVVVPIKQRDGKAAEQPAIAPVVMLMKAPGIPGAIHRMFNGLAFAKIKEPIQALTDSGQMVVCDEPGVQGLFVNVYKGIYAIREFWPEF